MGEPDAPITLTYARACGHFFGVASTCWMESCAPAASAAGAHSAQSPARPVQSCIFTSTLLALLADGTALELELDVPELDDVVVDQVVLLDLLVVHEGAVGAVQIGDLELPAFIPH